MCPSPNDATTSQRLDAGFTLLEVVVAFSILAISLGAIFHAFGGGASNLSHAERYTIATLLAQSQLARVGVELPYTVGETLGEFAETYRWRTVIRPADAAVSDTQASLDTQLYDVVVTVEWNGTGSSRAVRLQTFRLGEMPR